MYLGDAEALSLKRRQAYRARGDVSTERAYASMQRCKMQRIALTKLRALVEKVTRFTLELVMNLEFHLGIHHDPPAGRENNAHLKMSMYGYLQQELSRSGGLLLHFEIDTGLRYNNRP